MILYDDGSGGGDGVRGKVERISRILETNKVRIHSGMSIVDR